MSITVATIEVYGLGLHPLRLTECGSLPLRNGDQVVVPVDTAKAIKDRYPAFVKVSDPSTVEALANGHWEAKKVGPGVVETQRAGAASAPAKPANKTMAGKGQTKAKAQQADKPAEG